LQVGAPPADDEAWLDLHAPEWALQLRVEGRLLRGEPVPAAWLSQIHDPVRRARALWARGLIVEPTQLLDAHLADEPFDVRARIVRAEWALELRDSRRAERLLAPLRRMGMADAVAPLYRAAVRMSAEERARVEAIRAKYRTAQSDEQSKDASQP
jgi:hypothetical protein